MNNSCFSAAAIYNSSLTNGDATALSAIYYCIIIVFRVLPATQFHQVPPNNDNNYNLALWLVRLEADLSYLRVLQ